MMCCVDGDWFREEGKKEEKEQEEDQEENDELAGSELEAGL